MLPPLDLAYEAPEDADLVVDLTKDTVPEIVHGKCLLDW